MRITVIIRFSAERERRAGLEGPSGRTFCCMAAFFIECDYVEKAAAPSVYSAGD